MLGCFEKKDPFLSLLFFREVILALHEKVSLVDDDRHSAKQELARDVANSHCTALVVRCVDIEDRTPHPGSRRNITAAAVWSFRIECDDRDLQSDQAKCSDFTDSKLFENFLIIF